MLIINNYKHSCAGFYANISFQLIGIPRNVIAESYGKHVFSFLRNLSTVFQSGCTACIPTNND